MNIDFIIVYIKLEFCQSSIGIHINPECFLRFIMDATIPDFDSDYEEPNLSGSEVNCDVPNTDEKMDSSDGIGSTIRKSFGGKKGVNKSMKDSSSSIISNADLNSEKYAYKADRKFTGHFVIFYHAEFDKENFFIGTEYPIGFRAGSHMAVESLRFAMTNRGFKVSIYKDLTKREIGTVITKLAKADMTEFNMFGIAITSHGDSDGVIYVKNGYIHLNDVIDPIKQNKTLLKKPKVNKPRFTK